MTAFLPQYDPDPKYRETTLEQARAEYQYNHTYLSPLALIEKVPKKEEFSWKWMIHLAEGVLKIVENHRDVARHPAHRAAHHARHCWLSELIRTASFDFEAIAGVVRETLGSIPVAEGADCPEDFAALFRAIGLPAIEKDYKEDSIFAEMRVAGPSPLVIRRIVDLDDHFPVTEDHFRASEHYRAARSKDSLEEAKQEGRLYLADYQLLEEVENGGQFPEAQKYIYAPLALFVVDNESRRLMPLAIQCRQKPAPDNPIFTPDDGYNWLIAKTIVSIADGNYHEAVAHLGQTHLFVEPFVIATHRQLAPNHPVALLLLPHFEGTLAINFMARGHLVNQGGAIERLFGGTLRSTVGLTRKSQQILSFNDAMLPRRLKNQRLDDPNILPHYPYRDDALLFWDAIRQWVADYLALYYPSETDLQKDVELAGWFAELVSPNGGNIAGLQNDGTMSRLDYLAEVLTMILFTSSVQHAAVNFPQYDLMSYVPSMPLAAYAPAPTKKEGGTLADYLAMLPDPGTAVMQADLGYLLGSLHYTKLGDYSFGHFRDPRVWGSLETFKDQLATIGKTIDERNRSRRSSRPYTFLVPSGIPQSINV
ncbi:MAG TPA: lipoxygenase family protein [Gemmataceae bacterium]|nr:lipoxygenase family protein [Gemmataceae bacterium]